MFGYTESLGVLLQKGKGFSDGKTKLRGQPNSRMYPKTCIKTYQCDTSVLRVIFFPNPLTVFHQNSNESTDPEARLNIAAHLTGPLR